MTDPTVVPLASAPSLKLSHVERRLQVALSELALASTGVYPRSSRDITRDIVLLMRAYIRETALP